MTFAGCWIEEEGKAVIFFENGETVVGKLSRFKDVGV